MTGVTFEERQRQRRWEIEVAPRVNGVRAYFRRCGLSPEEVEDLTQETLLKSYPAFERIRIRFAIYAYIHRVAARVLSDYSKTKTRSARFSLSLPGTSESGGFYDEDYATLHPIDGGEWETPEESAIRSAQAEIVRAALLQLNKLDRTVLMLHYYEDRPFANIAAVLGRKEASIKMTACRARQRLAGLLRQQGFSEAAL